MIRYIHGSGDSTDLDVIYVFDAMPSFDTCRQFCASEPGENRNIIVVEDGVVSRCFKGCPDEVNNALLTTYCLHEQAYPLLIRRTVERDVFLKDIRVTRKLIPAFTRSPLRSKIKLALRLDWQTRLETLRELELKRLDLDTLRGWNKADLLKSIAFQLGQGIGLHQDTELYTKADIAKYFPELEPYLYRVDCELHGLQATMQKYLSILSQIQTETLPEGRMRILPSGEVYDIHKEIHIL